MVYFKETKWFVAACFKLL